MSKNTSNSSDTLEIIAEISPNIANEEDVIEEGTSKIARGAGLVGSMTLISRILGFLRDMVCARLFGAGTGFDAFAVAFKIPNFLRRLFAEGAFAQAFVPILSEYRSTRSRESVQKLLSHVAGVLGGIVLLVSVFGVILAPIIIRIFAPGFSEESARLQLATEMLQITFPYIFFISLSAFYGSILNSYDRYAMPAFSPVLLNLAMIICALYLGRYFTNSIVALAWGVFLGGLLQFIFLMYFLKRIKLLPKPTFSGDPKGVKRILTNMLPALFGVSVAQLNLLFDTIFASYLPKGSISWLYYSDRLMEFPLGVFGVALATVVLPHLSRQHTKQNHEDFVKTIDWSLQLILLIGIPASLGLALLATPLIITLFNYGKFSVQDVYMSSLSLQAFASGLIAFVSVKILAAANYARKDIKTPVVIATVCMIVNVLLSLILMQYFNHVGLALAMALTGFLNAGLLLSRLIKNKIYSPQNGWLKFLLRIFCANILWCILVVIFTPAPELWLQWSAFVRFAMLAVIMSCVIVIYFVALRVMGLNLKEQFNFR